MRCGLVAGVTAVTLVAGCAISSTAVQPDQPLDPTSAYVYGRFVIKAVPSAYAEKGRAELQTVGLVIQCDDGRTYRFFFSEEREVRVVKIRPARCAARELQYVNHMAIIVGSKVPPPAWIHRDHFAPGHGYYLGDFFAVASLAPLPNSANGYLLTWDMDPVDDGFADTTAELHKRFAGLAALPIHDQRLAPRRPALKRGLAGPNEPLMSPERIARLAGYVKNTFPTTTACQAACRTGDCLPYRASSGAAMACIVHCMTNRDCPATMACNCPSPSGADCQAIAATPDDPMTGICMPVGPSAAGSEAAPP